MSSYLGFSRNGSYTRDGCISPSIEDVQDLFPADMMDGLNDELGFSFDAYELMKDCTNMSGTSVDQYFPADNQSEFLPSCSAEQPKSKVKMKPVKNEIVESELPPGVVKPCYPYACLIALALKNSQDGKLSVADIYTFIMENFPYYEHAQPGWKNSIRHNLSLNKSFEKIEQPINNGHGSRKTYLWKMVSAMKNKMETELTKFPVNDVKKALRVPDDFDAIRNGTKGMPVVEQIRIPDFSEPGNSNTIVKKMNDFLKKEKERKSSENSSGIIKKSNQSVRQVAEMALGQLLHVKVDVDIIPVVKNRSRKHSVSDKLLKRQVKDEPQNFVAKKRRISNSLQTAETLSDTEFINNYETSDFHDSIRSWGDYSNESPETSGSTLSDRNGFSDSDILFENENQVKSTGNFVLNGLPFQRTFKFDDSASNQKYLKRANKFFTHSDPNDLHSDFRRVVYYPNGSGNKENVPF